MERLKYIVEDSTIAELLGVQNFTNKESAILELVKNAYDAQASTVSITFSDHSIVIVDDGIGMSKSTIYENWMHVGKSDKGYSLFGVGENDGRVLAGSKGVGRFALARLGESVAVYSVKKGEVPVKWTTDWSESILDDFLNEENLPTGTRIEISALRDRWTEKSIRNLIDEDSGVGLPPKYINDPMRILEVHESSRENGHGLGMWIVHNTIRMTGGDVISIDGHNGFHFNFELGEKL